MNIDQLLVLLVLLGALILFITERVRYDIVALLALLAVAVLDLVPEADLFAGFGHPAVITVAAVLVISRALINSGFVDLLTRGMERVGPNPAQQVAALAGLTALCSAFINNVAAVALVMPIAIQMARTHRYPASMVLMPIAYGSLLGGMTTLIGTPPNIILSTYRLEADLPPFGMFDFLPVGVGVTLAGVLYMALVGWRLIPVRQAQSTREAIFHISEYTAELRVPERGKLVGRPMNEATAFRKADVVIAGMIRDGRRVLAPPGTMQLRPGDILLVEASPDALKALIDATGFELVGSERAGERDLRSDDVGVVEAVVRTQSRLLDRTVREINLRRLYGVNLLAVARQGERLSERLSDIRLRAGDVLLLQGRTEALQEIMSALGCLPLTVRDLRLGQPQRIVQALLIFGGALLATTVGWLPIQVAFVAAAVLMILTGLISLREAYGSIEWPVIVLLGAMLPVADALEQTGGADALAAWFLSVAGQSSNVVALIAVLIGAMVLTPLLNNAAAAVLMAPIALSVARGLGVSPDPFLMAAAIGVSCDFVTPIGHQSNTLVMGPGGYRFGDYWRMGLAIELIVIAVATPLLLIFWPF